MLELKKRRRRRQSSSNYFDCHLCCSVVSITIAKTERRGKYNVAGRKVTKLEEGTDVRIECDCAPEGHFTTTKNNHIPNRWKALYAFVEFGKVPKEWRQVFEDDDKLGAAKTEQAGYIQPLSEK